MLITRGVKLLNMTEDLTNSPTFLMQLKVSDMCLLAPSRIPVRPYSHMRQPENPGRVFT
jgi:hypothetical protein